MPLRAAGQGATLRPARCSLGRGAALTGPRDSLVGEEQGVTGALGTEAASSGHGCAEGGGLAFPAAPKV